MLYQEGSYRDRDSSPSFGDLGLLFLIPGTLIIEDSRACKEVRDLTRIRWVIHEGAVILHDVSWSLMQDFNEVILIPIPK